MTASRTGASDRSSAIWLVTLSAADLVGLRWPLGAAKPYATGALSGLQHHSYAAQRHGRVTMPIWQLRVSVRTMYFHGRRGV